MLHILDKQNSILGNFIKEIRSVEIQNDPMRFRKNIERIAQVMNVETSAISVKATTTEKLGFVGREEGVEVYASVLVYKHN